MAEEYIEDDEDNLFTEFTIGERDFSEEDEEDFTEEEFNLIGFNRREEETIFYEFDRPENEDEEEE